MRYLLLFFPFLFFFSCADNSINEVAVKGQSAVRLPVSPAKLPGIYTGEFKNSPLLVVLTDVSDKQATGYGLHKGVTRKLSGVVEFTGGKLHLYLVEPGDSRYDGQFHLAIDTAIWKGEGSWKSFVTGTRVPFRFQKRVIEKEGDSKIFVDASSNFITLKGDGSCTYSYVNDSTSADRPMIVNGRYKTDVNKVTVNWQKNAVFAKRQSVFYVFSEKAFKGENYTQQSLRGEGSVYNEIIFN